MPKKIMVIGGGPAGMECALTAARRGHRVTLFEREAALGGQTRLAAVECGGGGEVFADLVESYEMELTSAGVERRLGTPVDAATVRAFAPDAVVIATGAGFAVPDVPGGDLPNVIHRQWTDPMELPPGTRVVVLGLGRPALVLAERLAYEGRTVTVIGPDACVGKGEIPGFEGRWPAVLEGLGVEVISEACLKSIGPAGVRVERGGETMDVPATVVIIGGPRRSVDGISEAIGAFIKDVYMIGDAVEPRSMSEAIHEGFDLGSQL